MCGYTVVPEDGRTLLCNFVWLYGYVPSAMPRPKSQFYPSMAKLDVGIIIIIIIIINKTHVK